MQRIAHFTIGALSFALLLSAGCGAAKKPNVLILTLDTTRADRLGCYGYTNAMTPCLDHLAAEGVLFEHAQSVMPLTMPTHATIFTGLLPIQHGVRLNNKEILPAEIPTLAEIFKAAGYRTGAVVATSILDPKFGLGRGFDSYDSRGSRMLAIRNADEVTDTALAWLFPKKTSPAGHFPSAPFFLWAHFYDPHITRSFHRDLFGNRFDNDYDAEIAFMDLHIGRLLDGLKERGLFEDTLIVAVADHGESLGEHGEDLHGFFIYQSTQHVPMIFKLPGRTAEGKRVKGTVSVRDLFPTVLDLAGVRLKAFAKPGSPRRAAVDALLPNTFADAVRGTRPFAARPCHMEALWTYTRFGWAPLCGVVNGDRSYIRAPEVELYNLHDDPGELSNIATREPRVADERAIELEAFDALATARKTRDAIISLEEGRRFASLGYVSGGRPVPMTVKADASLPDPKRFPGVIKAYAELISEGGRNLSPAERLSSGQLLSRAFPAKAIYRLHIGRAFLDLADDANALLAFERIGENEAERPDAVRGMTAALARLCDASVRKGDKPAAEAHLKRLEALDKGNAELSVLRHRIEKL